MSFRPSFFCSLFLAVPFSLTAPALAQPAPKAPLSAAIPDVRGLEYREVTLKQWIGVSIGNFQGSVHRAQPPVAHLWVLPAKDGEPRRGIGWNGVEYELEKVGAVAHWRSDVEARLQPRLQNQEYFLPRAFEFSGGVVSQVFLERLGAPELKRRARLSPGAFFGGPDANNPDAQYLYNLRDAGVSSFASGNLDQAKRQLQTLLAASPAEISPSVYDLRPEATLILADIARRETDAPRPSEEIAGLIWDLQNVRSFGGWDDDKTVQKLTELGDRAVEPLLEALENDDRLTLAVRVNPFRAQRFEPIATVRDVAQNTLGKLLKHLYSVTDYRLGVVAGQKQLAQQMRADWEKVKGQTPTERIFKVLAQSGQTPQRLEEAARDLVRIGKPYNINYTRMPDGTLRTDAPTQTFFGEPLRAHQNPSVSDVLEARITELTDRALNSKPTASDLDPTLATNINDPDPYASTRALRTANALALAYAKWDSKRALPLLGPQLERAKRFAAAAPRGVREEVERNLQRARRGFLQARLHTPFRADAMREYGAFLRSKSFGRFSAENYAPLWLFPNEPALAEATRTLFAPPRAPFQAAAQFQTGEFDYDAAFRLLHSPLVKLPVVKAAIARELGNKTVIGKLRATKTGEAEVLVTAWNWSGQTVNPGASRLENGASQLLRVGDLVGFWLWQNRPLPGGQDRYYPALDVSLPTPKRDARLAQIRVLVAQGRVVAEDGAFSDSDFSLEF